MITFSLLEDNSLYNIVLVSALYQHESAISIHRYFLLNCRSRIQLPTVNLCLWYTITSTVTKLNTHTHTHTHTHTKDSLSLSHSLFLF